VRTIRANAWARQRGPSSCHVLHVGLFSHHCAVTTRLKRRLERREFLIKGAAPVKLPSIEEIARTLYAGDFRNNFVPWEAADLTIRDLFLIQAAKVRSMAIC
jgi:hypothetical protein